jgi:hypothetical protein
MKLRGLILLLSLPCFVYGQSADKSFDTVRTKKLKFSDGTWQTSAVGKGTTIPAGNDVWINWGTITTKPRRWAAIKGGHEPFAELLHLDQPRRSS